MRTLRSLRFTLLLLIALTLVGSFPSRAQQATATAAATAAADQTPTFTALDMVSQADGWAVVTVPDSGSQDELPSEIYAGNFAYILHTHDGGQTWTNVMPAISPNLLPMDGTYGCDCSDNGLDDFFFLDSDHAWAMIGDPNVRAGQIFDGIGVRSTSSGGQSWRASVDGMNAPSIILSDFIDPQYGWILVAGISDPSSTDEPAQLDRTTDGGLHWKVVADDGKYDHPRIDLYAPVTPISTLATGITPMNHEDMAFESANEGWMLVYNIGPDQGQLLHTTDAGGSWSKVDVLPNNDTLDCAPDSLMVNPPGAISFHALCGDVNVLYHSTDDGKSWQRNPFPANVVDLQGWPLLFMSDASSGWALGCDPPDGDLQCDYGAQDNLFKTSDAGVTWNEVGALPAAFSAQISDDQTRVYAPDLDFIDDQNGWAIGSADGLLATTDGGKTWSAITPTISGI